MSEEAVRQTRSQKRALEKDAPPASSELSDAESDSKKAKMDDPAPEDLQPSSAPPNHDGGLVAPPDDQSRSRVDPEAPEARQEPAPNRLAALPVPVATPTPPPPAKDGPEQTQTQTPTPTPTQPTVEPISDNRTECADRAGGVKAEPAVVADTRSRLRPTEPRVSGGILASGAEVKATIKVEVQTAEPVDMSTTKGSVTEKRPPANEEEDDDDDVIILSDNDSPSPPMNGLSHFKELDTDLLMKSSPEERARIIKQLKQELRLEEAKLVLLKKLRQSQIQKDPLQKPSGLSGSAAPPPLIRGTMTGNKVSQQITIGRSSGTVIPPPLVRGGQLLSSKHASQIIMPPLVRGAQPISVSPQQIQALRQQQQQQQQQQLAASGGSGSGPPPLLLGTRVSAPGSQGQRGMGQSSHIRVGSVGNTNLLVNMSQASSTNLKAASMTSQSGSSNMTVVNVNDTPASRQAAAKLALRKQLEKTLLEIPPPKPPAPEFNFLPSAANNEFIYLVGLEEVVQNLLDTIHRGKTGVAISKLSLREPYTCTQCSTDFTCRWRQDKAKGGTILCEDCMSSNQKKALKAEHTNRLKAAFVKALQQEQEIEQRILQQSASPVSHSTSSTSSSSSSSPSMKADQLGQQQLKQVQAQVQARVSSMQHQHQHHHQHNRVQNIVHHHSSSIKQSPQGQLSRGTVSSMGVRGMPHSFSSSSQLQSAVAAAALVNRPGKHVRVSRPSAQSVKVSSRGISGRSGVSGASASASAWKRQSDGHTGVTMAYVNPSLSGHKTSSTVDARHREYLLDMIPSRSISQTANTWK